MGRRAAICARVSTADQSCERQVSELTSFAERCGFAVAGTFRDTAPGASASRAARKKVMDLAQARQIDAVLVSELSRRGRSTQDLLATLHQLARWKVSVVAMDGMTLELDAPHGRMMAAMLAGGRPVRARPDQRMREVGAGRGAGKGQEARPPAGTAAKVGQARAEGPSGRQRGTKLPMDRA